ncbi:hypothetical protein [Halovenus marina]|uniref:hypothetical protein n=1 Tax=Halovenus marina TaxID=3396621 RepID=UPI003F55464C
MSKNSSTNDTPAQESTGLPTRDADDNRDLLRRRKSVSHENLLPSLDEGITLLDIEAGRGVPVLQSVVLDHLLQHDGDAFWVDTNGHATTTQLARIAPSRRLIDRIHVARGFTPYQHYGAVCNLSSVINEALRDAVSNDTDPSQVYGRNATSQRNPPSLLVIPELDAHYRDADTLGDTHAQTLQARVLARLATYANGYDLPVLVTRTDKDEFTASLATAADHHLTCERTPMGPRFVGEEFETLVYPVESGYYQTTFAYWQQVLGIRARQVGLESPDNTQSMSSTTNVGTGVTSDGSSANLTANPLLDAWDGSASAAGW